jgi:D-alanyl-D-alanine endopeptidase (penicillin-binding protein 7)
MVFASLKKIVSLRLLSLTLPLALCSAAFAADSDSLARQVMGSDAPTFTNDNLRPWPYGPAASNSIDNRQPIPSKPYVSELPNVGSTGVIVYDILSDKVVFEKSPDVARPIASVSKLLTAMVVLDAEQPMDEFITMESVDFIGPKKASSKLRTGDRLNRAELLLATLMKSENPAAKSLARHYPGGFDAFMRAMNRKAQSLGMSSAFFGDPTGLDKRNQSSPRDLVKLVKAAGDYDVIRAFSTTKSYPFKTGGRDLTLSNTSYLVRNGVFDINISKTGFINEAGRCVVMETQVYGRPSIVVILGARSSAVRWSDAENLIHWLERKNQVT